MSIENHSKDSIDQDFISDLLLYDIKRKIEDSLVIPDVLLEKCDIDTEDPRLKIYVDKFCSDTDVESTVYTDVEINNAINMFITEEVNSVLKTQHIKLVNNLKRVASGQNNVPSIENIDRIEQFNLDEISDKDWVNLLLDNDGLNIHHQFVSDLTKQVDKIIEDMDNHSPWGLILSIINDSEKNKETQDNESGFKFDESGLDKHEKIFLNNLNQLIRIVRRVSLNYLDFVLSSLKNNHKLLATIKNNALAEFDDKVTDINNSFQTIEAVPMSRNERRELKKAAYTAGKSSLKTTVKIDNLDEQKNVDVGVLESTDEDYDSDDVREYIDIGEIELSLPWMDGQDNLKTKLYTGNKQDVFLVKAFSPRVKKISREAREGLTKNSKGEDKIDQKINQIVKRISEGIMPFQNTNSVKSLATDPKDISAPYREENIWYSFEIKPNAPRVYFTVHDTPHALKKYSDKDSKLVIIIAEADKARQLDTLSILTTLSVASLRARGAGSV